MQRKLFQHIASCIAAMKACEQSSNKDWYRKHKAAAEWFVREYMPSGSGIDNGTKLDETSTAQRLVFNLSYHHMNDAGMYDGWTDHKIVVTPDLTSEISIHVTGRDRNDIKDYLAETYQFALTRTLDDESESLRDIIGAA